MTFNLSLWIWVAMAVVAAWAVGAYGRLTRLRDNAERAQASLLKHLGGFAALDSPVGMDGADEWDQHKRHLTAFLERAHRPDAAESMVNELRPMLLALTSVVHRLREQPEDLAGAVIPHEIIGRWDMSLSDVLARQSRYNAHAAELNEALEQIPACWLARLVGLSRRELV